MDALSACEEEDDGDEACFCWPRLRASLMRRTATGKAKGFSTASGGNVASSGNSRRSDVKSYLK